MTTYPKRRVDAIARSLLAHGGWRHAVADRLPVARPNPDQTHPVIRGRWPFHLSLVNFHLEKRAEEWLREGRSEEGIRLVFLSHKSRPVADTLVVMPLAGFEHLSSIAMQHHAARISREERAYEPVADQR